MPRKLLTYTREEMETADFRPSRLWRAFRAKGPCTLLDLGFSPGEYASAHSVMQLLKQRGWIRYVGKHGAAYIMEALESPIAPEAPAPATNRIGSAKKALTRCIKSAEKGRRSGLAVEMGQALRDLEKDLREIRDSL